MKENKSLVVEAKEAIDNLIKKSRVHLYKPIQIAEILYRDRVYKDINILNLEDYRSKSKQWRDEISLPLLGRICTSSSKFQDNLFDDNAIPPRILSVLAKENREGNGIVEAYIYGNFDKRYTQLSTALNYCKNADIETFSVKTFIDSFWSQPGLKRSVDKLYEVIVYALFSTLIEKLNLQISVSVASSSIDLLGEFSDFANKVMKLDTENRIYSQEAKVYRVGVTNAADRGLDMYSNWGPAIQVKHLSLDEELAERIVSSISSDNIVIVCKDAEKKVILSLLNQIGWKNRIQSIITENELVDWYEKALRGKYSSILGMVLLEKLITEIELEFPSLVKFPKQILDRNYQNIKSDFWSV